MTIKPQTLVTKQEAAEIIGVSVRMVSRYTALRYLEVRKDARGHVRYLEAQCRAMNVFTPSPAGGDRLLTREEAADLIGVSSRRVGEYVHEERLTKYTDHRGRVRFSQRECEALTAFEPAG